MGQMYSAITCKICDNDPPCGNRKYEKIETHGTKPIEKIDSAGNQVMKE
jgi:hypothetical protein